MNPQLEKLLEDRKKKLNVVSPAISNIHEKTVRVEKNQVAGEKEFYTKRGKYIPKGDLYHIHYTKDLEVYYMSGGEHNEQTKLIFKSDLQSDDFSYYNQLNKQETLKLESKVTLPTEEDYSFGRMTRYFAKKTNESSSPFEVSADDFETSPLYDYVSLLWYIRGNKRRVFKYNRREILIASRTISNIGKLLPDYQYYRSTKKLTTKEEIQNRLGISSEQSQGEEPTQTTTTPKTNTQQSSPSGPPPGVMTGGAGGASGY